MATAASPTQQDVGRALRRARRKHNVELEDVATETRIPKRYLEALEDNAPLDIYPAPVYARAFLREYARFLELDPEPLLEHFGNGVADEVHLDAIREAVPPPRRWSGQVLLAMSIAGLAALAVVGVLSDRGSSPSVGKLANQAAAISPSPTGQQTAGGSHTPQSPPRTGINAAFHVTDRTWVRAVADGSLVVNGFWMGHWHVLHADTNLDLTLGNAGGTKLLLNGRHVPTGPTGQVLHLSMSFDRGKVHITRT